MSEEEARALTDSIRAALPLLAIGAWRRPTPEEQARVARIDRAIETAETCCECSRALAPDESVVLVAAYRFRGPSAAPACRACVGEQWWKLHGNPAMPIVHRRCRGCGRGVVRRWRSTLRYVTCSERCRRRAYRGQRRTDRPRGCATCGEGFVPARADARYCSGACRQRAYRRRRGDGRS